MLTDAVTKSDDDELRLVKDLFTNYSKEVRPVRNKNAAIKVIFGIAYTQLVELVSELNELFKVLRLSLLPPMEINQAIHKEFPKSSPALICCFSLDIAFTTG